MATLTSSTTVDLSRLPAPTIVELKTFDAIRSEMLADLESRLPRGVFNALVPSDPAIKVLDVAAYREMLIRQAFNDGGRQMLVAFADDANLDHLAALVGVSRLQISADVYEDDDALRQRIVLAPEGFSVAGPELAYVAFAKSADARVLDASATSPAPGEVLVSVLARAGDGTAPPELLDIVWTVVTDTATRPLGDAVSVQSAEIVPFAVVATITTFAGPDTALVLAAARAKLDAYLTTNRKLGRDITLSGLYAAMTVEGVQDVVIVSPGASVICDLTQAAHCTAIDVTHGGFGE